MIKLDILLIMKIPSLLNLMIFRLLRVKLQCLELTTKWRNTREDVVTNIVTIPTINTDTVTVDTETDTLRLRLRLRRDTPAPATRPALIRV